MSEVSGDLNLSQPNDTVPYLSNDVMGDIGVRSAFQNGTQTQPTVGSMLNLTSKAPPHFLQNGRSLLSFYSWFEYILLVLCFTGIVGNCLNLSVLTRRRFITALNNLESSANYGLVALAVSDLCYCTVVLPHVFLPGISGYVNENKSMWILGYKVYGIGFINLFQMTSTWIIVIIAVNRWVVVMYPLKAKRLIDKRITLYSILVTSLISFVFTLPYFFQLRIKRSSSMNNDGEFEYVIDSPWSDKVALGFGIYLRWIWPILASFVPLLMLVWCNIRLVMEIRNAIKHDGKDFSIGRRLHPQNKVVSKVTITLMSIVVMYFLLVTPAEIIRYVNPYAWWGKGIGIVVAQSLNLLQTVNFAFNFLLYCAVNVAFRQTFREMIRPRRKSPSFKPNDDNKTLQSLLSKRFLRSGSARSSATL